MLKLIPIYKEYIDNNKKSEIEKSILDLIVVHIGDVILDDITKECTNISNIE